MTSPIVFEKDKVENIWSPKHNLGEGAIWAGTEYWHVNIHGPSKAEVGEGPALFVHNPYNENTVRTYPMPSAIGTVVPVSDKNEALVALQGGIFALDLDTKALTHLCNPDNTPNNRLNDGKCSPEGRFWVGSMDFDLKANQGALFVMDRDRKTVRSMINGTSISNGIAWSLDSKTMYYIDTPTMVVQAFDYDVVEGRISNGRTAFAIPPNTGYPDGCTIDSTGNLWIAQWGGSRVVAYQPSDGSIIAEVHLPASNVTSVTFGGADLSDLYITTARQGLTEE